ncbi:hypothetical protein [Geodermatophilus sp. DSM 45219]|uniref:hypothetical protein n=1 Tax=Geodermatophilus sp. DSM 45219 TaxID=1881103 RepID=UPI000887BD1A|nr:hypothetical protein [Geodermatophilus sp. DSM 45219]SDO16546.1 hypothetical protein SAMN05428965_2964 [Geodermatophilus sp. DSM 45219]
MMTTYDMGPPGRRLRISTNDEVLRPGVAAHQLTLRISVHGSWLDPTDSQTSAAMIVEGTVEGGAPLRPLSLIQARVMNVRSFPINERLVVLLSDDQLLQLEVDREDGDVELQLDLSATFLNLPPGEYPTYDAQIAYRIPARRWLELLDSAGRLIGITVRVPSPLTDSATGGQVPRDTDPSLSRASKRLREARAALRDANPEACVRLCRHVLDSLRLLAPPQSAEAVRKTPPQSRTELQRWSALFHDLYSLASAASHDDDTTADFRWSREDAQALLAATAGLLARVRGDR